MTVITFPITVQTDAGSEEVTATILASASYKNSKTAIQIVISSMLIGVDIQLNADHILNSASAFVLVRRDTVIEQINESHHYTDLTDVIRFYITSALSHFEHGPVTLSDKTFRCIREVAQRLVLTDLELTY